MSYHNNAAKGLRNDNTHPPALGSAMQQGSQPKHKASTEGGLAQNMNQGGKYSNAKGSPCNSLGGVMRQGGSAKGK